MTPAPTYTVLMLLSNAFSCFLTWPRPPKPPKLTFAGNSLILPDF